MKAEEKALREEIRLEAQRIAAVRAQHPAPPPGVRAFDHRRFERHRRKGATYRHIHNLERRIADAELAKRGLSGLIGQKQQELREVTTTWRGVLRALWRKLWPWA